MNKTDALTLDENNNYIDSTTGKMMHVLTTNEMPTKQELMLGAQDENPSIAPTPDRIRHLAELITNMYNGCRNTTVTIDVLIYMLYELADIVENEEDPEDTNEKPS